MGTAFLHRIGAVLLVLLIASLIVRAIRGANALTEDTPWWSRNQEKFLTEAAGWTIAIILSITAIVWRDSLNANLYGTVALNGAVALVIRYVVPAIWVYFVWQSWRKSESENATDVMNIIQNDRIMGALSQGTVAAAVVSSSLASGKVEPEFLARWWLIILATSFSCVMITKVGSTFRPIEIWHEFTNNKYRK